MYEMSRVENTSQSHKTVNIRVALLGERDEIGIHK